MSGRGPRGGPPMERSRPYKVLCVSSLHPKASDDVVRDTLYREYKKYGDISVRVVLDPDGRVAYVYFRNFEDAQDARHSKSRIILFDKPAIVEPVYESRSESSYSSASRRRSVTPPSHSYPRYRSRSPPQYSSSSYRGSSNYRGGGDNYHQSSSHHRGDYRRGDHHDHPRSHSSRDYDGHGDGRGRGRGRGYRGSRPSRGRDDRGGRGSRGGHDGHDGRGGGSRDDGGDTYDRDGKRDKFPNYLDHIPPEDDPLATRTLFTGNLELNITEDEMRRIFGRYGNLLDIDIKRPPPGTGNAFSFIRYENLDMAHRAKAELSGQYIGKFQCKIGYGKVNATTKVWVGGLGSWCSSQLLWKEFDRFGAIKDIEYQTDDNQAHIYYENIDAAQAAVQEMRGHPLGGPDKRLRIDFADLDVVPTTRRDYDQYTDSGRGHGGRGRSNYRGSKDRRSDDHRRSDEFDVGCQDRRAGSPESGEDSSRGGNGASNASLSNVSTVADLGHKTNKVWDGGLILKNSLFPTKLHVIEGNCHIADNLKDEADKPNLKITQRLRLDQAKLDDVTRRMKTSSSHAIFLGLPTSVTIQHDNPDVQSRPLRNLISYLKQKEAAGVISMAGTDAQQGVLYCFPPCAYALDLLRREAPDLIDEGKDEFLVVVVVCGSPVVV
jgi:RNA-binding protein 15